MVTISEALGEAAGHLAAGRLDEAELVCRRILDRAPQCPEAWFLRGGAAYRLGHQDLAIQYLDQAIQADPDFADAHYHLGLIRQELGQLVDSAACYRRAIELDPSQARAFNNLGNVLKAQDKPAEAVEMYRRAIAVDPSLAEAHTNLGAMLKQQGQVDQAVGCYQRALDLNPHLAEAHNNLGSALQQQGKLAEAIACYARALELCPHLDEAHFNLGTAYKAQQRLDDAIGSYRRALERRPNFPAALCNLGSALQERGRLEEAVSCYHRALEIDPGFVEAHANLGVAYQEWAEPEQAAFACRRALELNPQSAELINNLGTALKALGRLDEAVVCHREAQKRKPDYPEAFNNLASALNDQALLGEAIAAYRHALLLRPQFAAAYSNLLYSLQFSPEYDAAAIYEEHRQWNANFAEPLAVSAGLHANERSVDRRLRIGYVSPDFREHCQSFFTIPLLSSHDHHDFEVFCYSDVIHCDAVTDRLKCHADTWRNVAGQSHEQVAQQIRADRIDVLVDLTMHMARNRALMFARKPAPIQVCWLAYPGTTGQTAIDYRLTDAHLDPPGLFDRYYSERSIRLPDTFWCYDPLTSEPAVSALPALQKGHITFGSLNSFGKLNTEVLKLWARVMRAVNGSRLALLAPEGAASRWAIAVLADEGIEPGRVDILSRRPRSDYLRLYRQIDIALDPFPYGGHTTNLDSLWMGVPMVTLVGETVVGRAGVSQLMNLGLPELIARSADEYVAITTEWASDLSRLAQLRSTLRQRLTASPLMDAPRFARGMESAYRMMWRTWCESGHG